MKKKLVIIILALFFMQFFVSCERKTAEVKAVFTLNCENNETLPCIVNFENQSLNSDSYLWNFGDGTVSTEENPSHQYTEKGDYKVILTANNKAGTDTVSQMFSVKDYRDKWVGDWYFMSIHSVWNFEQIFVIEGTDTTVTDVPPEIDTTFYNGHIFLGEEGNTVFLNHRENVNRKILVDTSGRIYHNDNLWKYYYNEGNFFGNDSIFYKFGEGGRGGGSNLYVYGKKQ